MLGTFAIAPLIGGLSTNIIFTDYLQMFQIRPGLEGTGNGDTELSGLVKRQIANI